MQSGGHKVLILIQMVCVSNFLEDLLRVKQFKYERLDVSKSASYQTGAVDLFYHMPYQSFYMILRTRERGMGLGIPAADTNIIFDNDWNP